MPKRQGFEVEEGKVTNYRPAARRGAQADSEFVQLELSVEEKKALRERYASFQEFDADFESLLSDGNKVTTKYDDRGRCYVSFAFAGEGSDNDGFILTGRGGSASRALRELAFKHVVLLEGDWAGYHNRPGATDDTDW